MLKPLFILTVFFSTSVLSQHSWLDKVTADNKKDQMKLRWQASGGEIDIQFAYNKLNIMGITVLPQAQSSKTSWDENHLVFPINSTKTLELFVPYGSIEKATGGSLQAHANFSLNYLGKTLTIDTLNFIPIEKNKNDLDIVTFKITDQDNNHLFTTDNVHIQYSNDRKLLLLKNMDIFATQELAQLLNMPELVNQSIGQFNTYSHLSIPDEAELSLKGGNCLTNPNFQGGVGVDVRLVTIGAIDWKGNVSGSDEIVIAPSAELENVGTADVPWYLKFTSNSPPYNNDQHPFLTWYVFREIDNRFEQIGLSGVKHAFFSTNINCSCPGGNVLGVGCGDVYSSGNNNQANALGPRDEITAFEGLWENCGSFFDPMPCTGQQQNTAGSTASGLNRLSISPSDIVPNLYMQAWYLIRDDTNIFNSMGYDQFNPALVNTTWVMNRSNNFNSGPAIHNYVPANSMSTNQASKTVATNEGHYTVAVKVVDLGNDLYRYNYAIENYDFDPKFNQFTLPLNDSPLITDMVFSDPDNNNLNDWDFIFSNNQLQVTGDSTNEQDWGMLFSFSFTAPAPPKQGVFTINIAEPVLNNTLSTTVLIPDLSNFDVMYKSSFEETIFD
jgi:hypothetical protein